MNFKELVLQCTSIEEVDKLKSHKDCEIRQAAYRNLGFTEKAFNDEYNEIRLEAYQTLGFTEKALDDEEWYIRKKAYLALGFTEKALGDEDWGIRLEAYRKLGFTEKAFYDDCWDIRLEAEIYFHIQKLKNGELEEVKELTIADLIKEARENGYKWIAQDKDGDIFFYINKPLYLDSKCFGGPRLFKEFKTRKSIKKWYEWDWTNSLIEVK